MVWFGLVGLVRFGLVWFGRLDLVYWFGRFGLVNLVNLVWYVWFGRFGLIRLVWLVYIVCIVCILCLVYIVCILCIVRIFRSTHSIFNKVVSELVSESVTDMGRLWSDLGPIKIKTSSGRMRRILEPPKRTVEGTLVQRVPTLHRRELWRTSAAID